MPPAAVRRGIRDRLRLGLRRGAAELSLVSFVAASAALHALCFYVFQIIYPPTAAPPAAAGTRQLYHPERPKKDACSCVGSKQKTRRFPRPLNGLRSKRAFVPPKPAYVPSYVNRQPALKEPPPFEPDLRVPEFASAGAGRRVPAHQCPPLAPTRPHERAIFRGTRSSAHLSFPRCSSPPRTTSLRRPPSFGSPSVRAARCGIASCRTPRAIRPWTNRRDSYLTARSLPDDRKPENGNRHRRPLDDRDHRVGKRHRGSFAHSRLSRPRRDPRQPCGARHDLFAGFSCGGFSPLDSWRVESPPA